jgi:hypothetical protein
MALRVETKDCTALTDTDLDEMASMSQGVGGFEIGLLSKAKEDWVLATTARFDDKLQGFMFSTLERIGGTPCVLIGLFAVKRTSKRDTALNGLMAEAFHRALMAFPDEDVLLGSRLVGPDGFDAFRNLEDIIPRPGHRAVGEERAWGRRLAKRFGVEPAYDEKTFLVGGNGQTGWLDHESAHPERIAPDIASLFDGIDRARGGCLVAYGWVMAENLIKLGARGA